MKKGRILKIYIYLFNIYKIFRISAETFAKNGVYNILDKEMML